MGVGSHARRHCAQSALWFRRQSFAFKRPGRVAHNEMKAGECSKILTRPQLPQLGVRSLPQCLTTTTHVPHSRCRSTTVCVCTVARPLEGSAV